MQKDDAIFIAFFDVPAMLIVGSGLLLLLATLCRCCYHSLKKSPSPPLLPQFQNPLDANESSPLLEMRDTSKDRLTI